MLTLTVGAMLVAGMTIAGSAGHWRPKAARRAETVGGGLLASALILLGASLHLNQF